MTKAAKKKIEEKPLKPRRRRYSLSRVVSDPCDLYCTADANWFVNGVHPDVLGLSFGKRWLTNLQPPNLIPSTGQFRVSEILVGAPIDVFKMWQDIALNVAVGSKPMRSHPLWMPPDRVISSPIGWVFHGWDTFHEVERLGDLAVYFCETDTTDHTIKPVGQVRVVLRGDIVRGR